MDVFLSTGERSGDVMAAAIARELQRRTGGALHIAGLAGALSSEAGVRNVFDNTDLALVGAERHKLHAWTRRLKALADLLCRRPPKVFVGITHCTFNLPLGGLLPKQTHRILVGPPEIWGWQANSLARFVALPLALTLWLRGDPFHWAHAALITVNRGPMALANFDELICLLPMNHRAYADLAAKRKAPTRVRMVGHPLAGLHRTPRLQADADALRDKLGIPDDAHVLGVFPGSRGAPVRLLLTTMLQAVVRVLNARRDVHAVVSVADTPFEAPIREAMARAAEKLDSPNRLLASPADASALLAASSHALLSSGTITLQAACLRTPGTIGYVLRRHWLLLRFVRQGRVRGRPVPWGLPNAILAQQGADLDRLPYPEFVYRKFRAPAIAESILDRLPPGPRRREAHPLLDPQVADAVRAAIQPSADEPPCVAEHPGPVAAVAESVLRHLGRA